jgi:hypothetical protein
MTVPAEHIAHSARFALERFAWDAPDRLEVSGWFDGLDVELTDPPVLVVEDGDGSRRLPAVPERLAWPPGEGQRWWAAFEWSDEPAAFERATLELGAGLAIDLPQPNAKRTRRDERTLEVRRSEPDATPDSSAGRLALEADLLLAQEEVLSLRAAMERTRRELDRARQDAEAERGRRTADAERFRDGLGRVRASAEDAIANERATARQATDELEGARRMLAAQMERTQALEQALEDVGRQRAGLDAACAETERLLARLTSLRDGMGDGNAP